MRLVIGILAVVVGLASPVLGQEKTELRSLITADDNRGWEAVGRLDIAGRNMCTGALIRPDLVLTAAHCLYDKRSGAPVDPTTIEFLAGWRNGRANAYRMVRRAVEHPSYQYSTDGDPRRVRFDLAVLQLAQPIRKTTVVPFEIDSRPRAGDEIGIVSYGRGRSDKPSLQEACHVLARQFGGLVMSCDVDFGSSGSPVFSMRSGIPRIVSVVSAMGVVRERQVSLGTSLEEPLAELIQIIEASDGQIQAAPTVRRISPRDRRKPGGAKFLRP